MLIKKNFTKITTAIATGAILLSTVTPALAATGVGVVGNGAESTNTVNVTKNNTSTAVQSNSADISNTVSSTANSGGNTADFNTGGSSSITTGPAANAVSISNEANSNKLSTGDPCGCSDPTQVVVKGNGAFSNNAANVTSNNNNSAYQTNTADFTNNVTNNANTGDNSGSYNTGGGTSIFTGPAKNATQIDNKANENVMFGGSTGAGNGGSSLIIGDNGALSANAINATNNNTSTAVQSNDAAFSNYVDNTANTGDNTADFNTGGGVRLQTGGAFNWTDISNAANRNVIANFNDCGCATGDLLKEVGNGAFSANAINATNNNDQSQYQTNSADYTNAVTNDATSGDNSASYGTEGFWGFDPSVLTGPTGSNTQVNSSANQNVLTSTGSHSDVSFGGWNVNLGWDPASVMGMFQM